ncbi:hypothetical protein NMG60_11021260 [Bertholletia excelsa]
MSRREGRDSDSKRHRSRFDREPSPKRSRRDGKPATERPSNNLNLDVGEHLDRNEKHHRQLRDALPLEAQHALNSKVETGAGSKESDKKTNGHHEGAKHSSKLTEVPRSRSYFQHDERGNAGQAGRTAGRGSASGKERGWWNDSKDQHSERAMSKTGTEQVDEKSKSQGGDNRVWKHDGFYEIEVERQLPARRRPSFTEKKLPADPQTEGKAEAETLKPTHPERPLLGRERKEERGGHTLRYSDRPDKPFSGNRDTTRGSFPSRERYDGGGGYYRGRERFGGRRGNYRPSGGRVEKWKHDLFEEANRSPTPKNEEDHIAKVEALLTS